MTGGTPLLAEVIRNAIKKEENDPLPTLLTYDQKLLAKKDNSWCELLINLSLYPGKAGALDTPVYRINTGKVWSQGKVWIQSKGWIQGKGWINDTNTTPPQKNPYQKLVEEMPKKSTESKYVINVINDRGLGFRELTEAKLNALFPEHDNAHFVIALGNPLKDGLYNEKLRLNNRPESSQSIIVLHAASLRRAGIDIREAASIEQTVQNFLYHLDKNDLLKNICKCRHLVVRFDDGGVLHYDLSGDPTYHYCPFFNTNETYIPLKYGCMSEYRTIVTAITKGIAWALQNDKDVTEGINNGIRLGVLLGKYHFREGFAKRNDAVLLGNSHDSEKNKLIENALIKLFDTFDRGKKKVEDLEKSSQSMDTKGFELCREYSVASLKLPRTQHELKDWSRVYSFQDYLKNDQSLFEKAVQDIVLDGLDQVVFDRTSEDLSEGSGSAWFPKPRVLCPYVEFGRIRTSDRSEIDSLYGLSAIIRKYLEDHNWRKPLSIATFGPPGSGKSLTVKQILKSVSPSAGDTTLEYNVAQFTSVSNLTTAFHQAQDKALSEKVPLIIFDEFDATFNTESYGWLKYFLAPMQDGVFKAEHGTYQVGKAIFVFAGGTSHTFENFCNKLTSSSSLENAKGLDFISRLRGYLNIRDINPMKSNAVKDENNLLMYRRAIILRSILEDKAVEIFDRDTGKISIDPKVARAFLKVPEYKHGVRSMEAIIEMANLAEGFVPASLPPRNQLQMHVDADEFLRLVEESATSNDA